MQHLQNPRARLAATAVAMSSAVVALLVGVLLAAASPSAAPDDVAVVVNKANPIANLTIAQLRRIVLAEQAKWPSGAKIVVWMTPRGQPERVRALKVVCGMSETDFTLHFMHAPLNAESGDPPRTAASVAQLREWVAAAVNGLGFIPASQADASVKVVAIEGARPGEPTYKLAAN